MAIPAPGSSSNAVKVIVSSDISGLKQGMAEARREIEQTGTATEAAAVRMGGMGQAADAMRGQVAAATGDFSGLTEAALRFAPAVGVAGVGALVAFAVATKQGYDETARLNRELAMSGNAAGTTVGQLQMLAAGVAQSAETTRGAVAEAMAELLAAGNVGAASIAKASEAAVLLERVGGQAVEKTAAAFARLGEASVKASIALNETYGYLTAAVLKQIKALEDQGRVTEAVQLAQDTFATASIERMREVAQSLGWLERGWNAVGLVAKSAWDSMRGLGRGSNAEGALVDAQRQLEFAMASGSGEAEIASLQRRVDLAQAAADAERAAAQAKGEQVARNKAGSAWELEADRFLTRREQKEREITRARTLGVAAGKSDLEIQQRLAAIEERYAEKARAPRAPRAPRDPDMAAVGRLRLDDRAAEAGLAPKTITELDALAAVRQKTNMAEAEYLRLAGIAMANDPVIAANKRAIALELNAAAEATQYLSDLQGKFDRSNQATIDSFQALPEGVARLNAELRKVDEQAARAESRLARMHGDGKLSAEEYAAGLAKLNAAIARQKGEVGELNDQQGRLNASWEYGADRALMSYAERAGDVASASEQAFTRAFSGMEDALVEFAMTGKLNFSSLANSIVADIIRIQLRASMTSALGGAGGGGGWSGLISAAVGYFTGGSSATGLASLPSSVNTTFANGAAFSGSPSLHRYVNTVQSSPTTFAFDRLHGFAKGGVFAEAGPEAVMPLTRDASGRLGVSAQGSAAPVININVKNEAAADGYQATASANNNGDGVDVELIVKRVISADQSRNGPITQGIASTFGLRRKV